MKFNESLLKSLEQLLKDAGLKLRYEKGNFKAGHCLLLQQQVVVVNKYYSLEGKIASLLDVIDEVRLDADGLDESNQKLLASIQKYRQRKNVQPSSNVEEL